MWKDTPKRKSAPAASAMPWKSARCDALRQPKASESLAEEQRRYVR